MEQKKQLGGKRKGAGRKPVLSKKKQISLYVEGAKIIKFGGEEKMKEHLYLVIDKYGIEPNYENPISLLKELPNYSVHDIKPKEAIVAPVSKSEAIIPPKPISEAESSVIEFEKYTSADFDGSKANRAIQDEVSQWQEPKNNIPPMPTRNEGEDAFDFAQRKNEWKRLYQK